MEVIIVEDEKYARENLEKMLRELRPDCTVLATFDRVETTVQWLSNHHPDLIFLDIHLADALSFSIFEKVEVTSPVIFTTAYDHYAIKAFEVNSIGYLLKPYDKSDLERTLEKYDKLHRPEPSTLAILQEALSRSNPTYQERFIVKKGERIASVKVSDVAYFSGEDRYVSLVKKDGKKYFVEYKLSELEEKLDPAIFFRLNRSFICHFDAIKEIFSVSKSRVQVELDPPSERKIIVSTENTRLFKAWLDR
jgi:two-component system response regulator LytT